MKTYRKTKKKPGRPVLPDAQKRSHKVTVKFNEKEFSKVEVDAAIAGIAVAAFVRGAAISATIRERLTTEQLKEHREAVTVFGNLGNNINQLTRHLNSGLPGEAAAYLDKLRHILDNARRYESEFLECLSEEDRTESFKK